MSVLKKARAALWTVPEARPSCDFQGRLVPVVTVLLGGGRSKGGTGDVREPGEH